MSSQPISEHDPRVLEVLARPYSYVMREGPDHLWTIRVLELPGCISEGGDPVEAVANVREAFAGVVAVLLEEGADIPVPVAEREDLAPAHVL